MLTAITGINWGDEGKGRMVDLISQEYDIVARYQGGNNAGHTVKNERGKFVLNLLPSGILRPNVVCVMGNGMVIDPHHLDGEINKLREQGVEISPANLKISDRATITMPYHVEQDGLEEARLSKTGAQFGSTKRGIAYAYGDKYMKKTLRMGDLLHLDDAVKKRLVTMVDSKNLVMEGSYNAAPISVDEMWAWLEKYAAIFKDYICDVGQYLADADAAGKKVLFEAQLGALRDIDFGIYPYTTSSNVIGAYAPIGAGIPGHKLHNSIGVMKAYSSCVGDEQGGKRRIKSTGLLRTPFYTSTAANTLFHIGTTFIALRDSACRTMLHAVSAMVAKFCVDSRNARHRNSAFA